MRRLIEAITEFFEARAELLREESAVLNLGTYARAYKDGQEDATCCCESYSDCDED